MRRGGGELEGSKEICHLCNLGKNIFFKKRVVLERVLVPVYEYCIALVLLSDS